MEAITDIKEARSICLRNTDKSSKAHQKKNTKKKNIPAGPEEGARAEERTTV